MEQFIKWMTERSLRNAHEMQAIFNYYDDITDLLIPGGRCHTPHFEKKLRKQQRNVGKIPKRYVALHLLLAKFNYFIILTKFSHRHNRIFENCLQLAFFIDFSINFMKLFFCFQEDPPSGPYKTLLNRLSIYFRHFCSWIKARL